MPECYRATCRTVRQVREPAPAYPRDQSCREQLQVAVAPSDSAYRPVQHVTEDIDTIREEERTIREKPLISLALSDPEEDFVKALQVLLGPSEMTRNGGLWRTLIRESPLSRKVIHFIVEELQNMRPDSLPLEKYKRHMKILEKGSEEPGAASTTA